MIVQHYVTRDGDMLDWICSKVYGRTDVVEAVLEANPGLAALGPVYDAGQIVVLPDMPAPTKEMVRLWD